MSYESSGSLLRQVHGRAVSRHRAVAARRRPRKAHPLIPNAAEGQLGLYYGLPDDDGLGFSLKPPKWLRKASVQVRKAVTLKRVGEAALIAGAAFAAPAAVGLIAKGAAAAGRFALPYAKEAAGALLKRAIPIGPVPTGPVLTASVPGNWANPDAYNGVWDALYANAHKRQVSAQNDPEFAAWAQAKAAGGAVPPGSPWSTSGTAPIPTAPSGGGGIPYGGGGPTDGGGGAAMPGAAPVPSQIAADEGAPTQSSFAGGGATGLIVGAAGIVALMMIMKSKKR